MKYKITNMGQKYCCPPVCPILVHYVMTIFHGFCSLRLILVGLFFSVLKTLFYIAVFFFSCSFTAQSCIFSFYL